MRGNLNFHFIPGLWFFLLFVVQGQLYAQSERSSEIPVKVLELKKAGSHKNYIFEKGDLLRFRLRDRDTYSRGVILDFVGDSTLLFDRGEVEFLDIAEIDIRDKSGNPGAYFIVAGVGYFGIDQFNRLVLQGESGRDLAALKAGAVLVGTGLLLILLKRRYIKVGGRWYLRFRESNTYLIPRS